MRRSSNPIAACAVAATVLAACAAESPSPARSSTFSRLYATGSDVAVPSRGGPLVLRASPGSDRILARVGPRTAFGSPTKLAVTGESGDWLAVISAALGNRVRGFVHRSRARLRHDPYSVEIDRSERRLTVWRMGIGLRRIHVAIGAPATPTPRGDFAVTDKLSNFWPSLYGCCVLALSGRQMHATPGWTGGARLAIHVGTGIGRAVSNGCVRAAEADVRYLMRMLPLGTQVVVHP
jgi:lipoprotein-anchoring transpeptidase ErfK/SrfK